MFEKLKQFFYNKNIFSKRNIIIFSILFLLLVVFIIFIDFAIFIFNFLLNIYSDILIAGVKIIYSTFKNELFFDFLNNSIILKDDTILVDRFFFSLNQLLAIFILVLITKSKFKDKIIFFIVGFVAITLYNIIRISVHVSLPDTISVHHWFFILMLIPRWIIVIFFTYYLWKRNPKTKDFIIEKLNLREKYFSSFYIKLSIANILYAFLIIWAFSDVFILNGETFVSFILNSSKSILDSFGLQSWIRGRYLYSDLVSLYMDDACIGINLMFLFAVFIAVLPGKVLHKIWYITTGLLVIIFLNIARIVLIFVNLTNNQGYYKLPLEIHDIFTYPVLVVTFIMWAIWINKFVKIENNKSLKENNEIDIL
jgi:exosortase/archaeosortase family protein